MMWLFVLVLSVLEITAIPFRFPRAGFVAPLPRMARPNHASRVENGWVTGRSPSSTETESSQSLPPQPPSTIELPASPSPTPPTEPEPQNRDYRKPPPFVEFNDVDTCTPEPCRVDRIH
eukprot:g5096.t1